MRASFSMPWNRLSTIGVPSTAAALSITAIAATKTDSSGRRNTDFVHSWQQLVKCLCRSFPFAGIVAAPGALGSQRIAHDFH